MRKEVFKNLTKKERVIFEYLDTPQKIQSYLNKLPQNFEKSGETCLSPRRVLRENTAHCIEGALLAATLLWYHGRAPLVMHLKTLAHDQDHVVALFKQNGYFGALSKTNHAVLRYRDPVYKTVRELALSFFHEYFLDNGNKTLIGYTKPFDLSKLGDSWVTNEKDLWKINDKLFHLPHKKIGPSKTMGHLRRADPVEIKYGKIVEWEKDN